MSYALATSILDTRRHLKDTTQNVWTDADIIAFIGEATRIIKKSLPLYFTALAAVTSGNIDIDEDYGFILGIFAAARCFEQDEQNYRAVQKMNEFEVRKSEMIEEILNSDDYAAILDSLDNQTEYVTDVYFNSTSTDELTPVADL